MAICFKRLYLVLFLLFSFVSEALIKRLNFASFYYSHKGLRFQHIIHNKLFITSQNLEMKLFIIVAFLTILILITGLLLQTYKRLNAQRLLNVQQGEINSQKMESILKEQELKLVRTWINAQEKERNRISKELQQSIGKNLASIKLQINHLNNSNLQNITKINLQVEETFKLVQNLSHALVPKKFSPDKFCEVLTSYLENLSIASQLNISFVSYSKDQVNIVNEAIQVEVFKIIQDLVTHTIKYAGASKIEIQLHLIGNSLTLLLDDDGSDFNSEKYKQGFDVIQLETRINKLNGLYLIDSQPKSTGIFIEIPTLVLYNETKSNIKTVKGINLKNQLDELKSKF